MADPTLVEILEEALNEADTEPDLSDAYSGLRSMVRQALAVAREQEREQSAISDSWARYQRNDLSQEEFEGFIAERFERRP